MSHPVGTIARAHFTDGSGSELALRTVSGWVGERGPISRDTEQLYRFEVLIGAELNPVDGIVYTGENATDVLGWLAVRSVGAEIDEHGVLWAGGPVRAISVNSLLQVATGELSVQPMQRLADDSFAERAPGSDRHPADVVLSRTLERIATLEAALRALADDPWVDHRVRATLRRALDAGSSNDSQTR